MFCSLPYELVPWLQTPIDSPAGGDGGVTGNQQSGLDLGAGWDAVYSFAKGSQFWLGRVGLRSQFQSPLNH
ncbi:hypothetical protein [Adonisia turfae]|uniref:Uncharacterized protein n=1 Tax=Adonisia turfae CCMR0081 TaxID=2292702 RepID=A0A6M0REI1_9CYAN|nr:hypothetical protein [Adonisia turfae]NEZ54310.1 hypothetical protein [Adonisia turfae CCMR0081]